MLDLPSRFAQHYQPVHPETIGVHDELEKGASEAIDQSRDLDTYSRPWRQRNFNLQPLSLILTLLILILQVVIISQSGHGCNIEPYSGSPLPNIAMEASKAKWDSPQPCGTSADEARALGCTFDQLIWSWLPPSCPHYANDEFVELENWTYWMDNQKREAMTTKNWERALNNEVQLWGESREHLAHCVYIFLSIAQILRDRTPYPSYFEDYEHTYHCAGVLMEALRKEPKRSRIATFVGNVSFQQRCVEFF